jgi:prevent-host-death family protein
MTQISACEAKNLLSELLRRAESGEEIAITRGGRVVARLVPPEPEIPGDGVRAAIARVRARRKEITLGGLSIKELIAEGRR